MCRMYVDDVLIRVFQNNEAHGYPYLSKQPMGVYSSIFDASQWATRGGLVQIDFDNAPFLAHYTNFTLDACTVDETAALPNAASQACAAPTSSESSLATPHTLTVHFCINVQSE